MTGCGMLHACRYSRLKSFAVGHRVIGGHHDHDAVLVLRGDRHRSNSQRRRRIAASGFENQPRRFAARAQLLGGGEALFFVGDNDELSAKRITRFESIESVRGGLQQ